MPKIVGEEQATETIVDPAISDKAAIVAQNVDSNENLIENGNVAQVEESKPVE